MTTCYVVPWMESGTEKGHSSSFPGGNLNKVETSDNGQVSVPVH